MGSTNLTSDAASRRTLVFFALGGSGMRTLEALLHFCALGLGPRNLKVILVDPDEDNPAVTRARQLLDRYRRIRNEFKAIGEVPAGYFGTDVVDGLDRGVVWSPVAEHGDNTSLAFEARIDRPLMVKDGAKLGALTDALFGRELREMDLGKGFRGVPSIGTVFMNRLRQEAFFESLITAAQTDADTVFFAAGSVFGGTGAAALPVVANALAEGVQRDGVQTNTLGVNRRRVGAALLLPYFTLPPVSATRAADGGIRPESALFSQNAAAAMSAYADPGAGIKYGAYYVLGDSEPRIQRVNSEGGREQNNAGHYVEMFAALAALDFSARGGEATEAKLPQFRILGAGDRNLGWRDLPLDETGLRRLLGGLVATHSYLTIFRPNGHPQPALQRMLKGLTWLQLLDLKLQDFERYSGLLDNLGSYYMEVWQWARDLTTSEPAFAILRNASKQPSELRHDELLHGRTSLRRQPRATVDGMQVFRHWNSAAFRHKGGGWKSLLSVMREGSEGFADAHFPEYDKSQGRSA